MVLLIRAAPSPGTAEHNTPVKFNRGQVTGMAGAGTAAVWRGTSAGAGIRAGAGAGGAAGTTFAATASGGAAAGSMIPAGGDAGTV